MSGANPRESEYFNTLPAYLQESILQSGIHFGSDEEIQQFVSQILKQ